jgi:hypothetical protein
MGDHARDIFHQPFRLREYVLIDTLVDVAGALITLHVGGDKGIVNMPAAQRNRTYQATV